ncbi:MAG: nucleoside-diphosphate kinase [Actinomycetota bacterium]
MSESTLVLIKPDGVRRNLIGEIIRRCEAKGYVVAELKKITPTRELLAAHYAEHEGKVFYEPLMEFMLSGDVVAIRLTGHRVIEGFRSIAGATDPTVAAASRDWGTKVVQNLVHGSDSVESAQRELSLWF